MNRRSRAVPHERGGELARPSLLVIPPGRGSRSLCGCCGRRASSMSRVSCTARPVVPARARKIMGSGIARHRCQKARIDYVLVGLPQHDRGRIETVRFGGNGPVNGPVAIRPLRGNRRLVRVTTRFRGTARYTVGNYQPRTRSPCDGRRARSRSPQARKPDPDWWGCSAGECFIVCVGRRASARSAACADIHGFGVADDGSRLG